MAVISVFTFNGETDILKLHLAITSPFVDKYIIVEANQTFTGHPKPLYFFRDQRWFKQYWNKIDYFIVNNWEDEELWSLARNSPNTKGAHHWQREFYIKENILKALKASGVQDSDTVFVGDVDEIFDADPEGEEIKYPAKLKLKVYAYYLNNRSSEEFWGTYVAKYKDFKGKVLNHERSRTDIRTEKEYGWHFTSMGGVKEVQRKLNDSYTPETYNTAEVQLLLPERIEKGIDYLGRPFTFKKNEDEWPDYLLKNRQKFSHLCRKSPSRIREIVH